MRSYLKSFHKMDDSIFELFTFKTSIFPFLNSILFLFFGVDFQVSNLTPCALSSNDSFSTFPPMMLDLAVPRYPSGSNPYSVGSD